MPYKPQLGRLPWPDGGNNRRHALRGREYKFSAVRRAGANSQQPITTKQPASREDTHTHGKKNILKRAWDVVRGFCRGVSEKIRNALDLEFLE